WPRRPRTGPGRSAWRWRRDRPAGPLRRARVDCWGALFGDHLGDPRDPVHDDPFDAGLERHHRHRAGAARSDERDVDGAVGVDAVEDDVATVALQRGTEGIDGLEDSSFSVVGVCIAWYELLVLVTRPASWSSPTFRPGR